MRKGAISHVYRILAWALLCLAFFSLGGCAVKNVENTIILKEDEYSPYDKVISKTLPSYSIVKKVDSRRPYAALDLGRDVETFDVQAMSALENGLPWHWYPHFSATMVIAVDRDRTDVQIGGWKDLLDIHETIGYSDLYPDMHLMMGAIAYGLEGGGFTLKEATSLLETINAEKRLVPNTFDAPLVICYDYQAAALIKAGGNIETIVPEEGTLTYQKGLMSVDKLSFAGDLDGELLSAGFRLTDGRCEESLYPDKEAYKNAGVIGNYAHFTTAIQEANRVFQRRVLHTRLCTSADGREHQLFALFYSVLVFLWTASFIGRAMDKDVRKIAFIVGIILFSWITIRLIKYQMIDTATTNRYLWYSYYIFQMSLPLALLWLTQVMDRTDLNKKPGKWLRVLGIINGILIIFVLTNDLHNWIFVLDFSKLNWPEDYSYGFVFVFVTAAWFLPFVADIIILMVKSGRNPRKGGLVFVPAFATLLTLYTVGYITRVPIAWKSDYTMVVGLFSLLFMEICMRTGMVPVNTKYNRLFIHSPLNMLIVDRQGTPVLSSKAAIKVDNQQIERAMASYPRPIEQDEDTLLFATNIVGGCFLWQEDISSLNNLHRAIKESIERLTAANIGLSEEKEIKGALYEENEKTRLTIQLEDEILEYIIRLSTMIEGLPGADDPQKQILRIALLLCYIKRRSNLFFRGQETNDLPADELTVYIDELAEMADYLGIKTLVASEIKMSIPIGYATLFYDFFYTFLDWASDRECPYMLIHLGYAQDTVILKLLPSGDPRFFKLKGNLEKAITSAGGIFSVKDLEGAIGISLTFPWKGAGGNG